MRPYREKLSQYYHTVKNNNKLLGLAVILTLGIAILPTFSLTQKVLDVRQHADAQPMSIAVNPVRVMQGESFSVSWAPQTPGAPTNPVTPTSTPPPAVVTQIPTITTAPTQPQSFSVQNLRVTENTCANGEVKISLAWDPPAGVTGTFTYVVTPQSFGTAARTYPGETVTTTTYTKATGLSKNTNFTFHVDALLNGNASTFLGAIVSLDTQSCTLGIKNKDSKIAHNKQTLFSKLIPKVYAQTSTLTGGETIKLVNTTGNTIVGQPLYLNCKPNTSTPPTAPINAGSCSYNVPGNTQPGIYLFRMYAANGTTVLGESGLITVDENKSGLAPIYRLLKTDNSTFYWGTITEKDNMISEKLNEQPIWNSTPAIAWYAYMTTRPGTTPIYRYARAAQEYFYWATPTDPFLTQAFNGVTIWDPKPAIAWYAYETKQPGTVPVYRLAKSDKSAFYWAIGSEKDTMLAQAYNGVKVWDQNPVIVWYVYASPADVPTPTPFPTATSIPTTAPTATRAPTATIAPTATAAPQPTTRPTNTPAPAQPTQNPNYQNEYDPNNGGGAGNGGN